MEQRRECESGEGEAKRGEKERESAVRAQATERHHRGLIKYGNYNC